MCLKALAEKLKALFLKKTTKNKTNFVHKILEIFVLNDEGKEMSILQKLDKKNNLPFKKMVITLNQIKLRRVRCY